MTMDLAAAKKYATLDKVNEEVYLLNIKQKVFSIPFSRALHFYLDELEKTDGPLCLVTTADHPKIFSAGFDFKVFVGHKQDVIGRLQEFARILARFLSLGFPTICAISGECYASGFMFALSHDFRFMRNDHGKICLSEINNGMPIPRAFNN